MAIVIRDLGAAVAALTAAAETGRPVALWSPPDGSERLGAAFFLAVVRAARARVPGATVEATLDCGERPGDALAALRLGCTRVCFRGRADVARRLADIARQQGARLVRKRPGAALDLAEADDAAAACRAWIARRAAAL